jgi:hypothetical protein
VLTWPTIGSCPRKLVILEGGGGEEEWAVTTEVEGRASSGLGWTVVTSEELRLIFLVFGTADGYGEVAPPPPRPQRRRQDGRRKMTGQSRASGSRLSRSYNHSGYEKTCPRVAKLFPFWLFGTWNFPRNLMRQTLCIHNWHALTKPGINNMQNYKSYFNFI